MKRWLLISTLVCASAHAQVVTQPGPPFATLSITGSANDTLKIDGPVAGLNATWDLGMVHAQRQIATLDSSSHNNHGMSSLLWVSDTNPSANGELGAVVGFAKSSAPKGTFEVDMVGMIGEGVIAAGNTAGTVWGGLSEVATQDATADGAMRAHEFGVNNLGSVVTAIDGPWGKYGIWLNSPGNEATSAITMAASQAGKWHYGLYFRGVTADFAHFALPQSGAVGVNFDNSANWGNAINLPNASALAGWNATQAGTVSLIRVNSSNAAELPSATQAPVSLSAAVLNAGTIGTPSFTAGTDANGGVLIGVASSVGTPYISFQGNSIASFNIRLLNNASGSIQMVGTGSNTPTFNLNAGNIVQVAQIRSNTAAPTLTSCGGGSPAATGSDVAGQITEGTTATGCIVTFATSFNSAPTCVVTSHAGNSITSWSTLAASLTIVNGSASGNKYDYVCIQ